MLLMLLMLLMSMIIIRHQISFSLLTVHLMDTRRARRDPERTTQSTCVLRRPSGLTSRRNLQSTLCHLIPEGILTYTIEYIYICIYIYTSIYTYIYNTIEHSNTLPTLKERKTIDYSEAEPCRRGWDRHRDRFSVRGSHDWHDWCSGYCLRSVWWWWWWRWWWWRWWWWWWYRYRYSWSDDPAAKQVKNVTSHFSEMPGTSDFADFFLQIFGHFWFEGL